MRARYTVHTQKALEVILWLATARPGIDVYHIVKCSYFADKKHLNDYGRPIAGDWYRAAPYGPLGQCVYGLLTRDPIGLLALESNGHLPLTVSEDFSVTPARDPNLGLLSRSDVEALRWALDTYGDKSFRELLEESHQEEAYRNAEGGRISYEDMLDHSADREERARELAENAKDAVF
jgi:hypothetical protein